MINNLANNVKTFILRNSVVAIASLIMHGIWEYVFCGILYAFDDIKNMNTLMVEATIGDVGIALLIFNVILIFRNDINHNFSLKDYLIVVIYGIVMAFFFETKALAIDRWIYSESMILVPGTNIGFAPIIQLILLLPIAFFLEASISTKLKNKKWK